jgi:hypothetical protein
LLLGEPVVGNSVGLLLGEFEVGNSAGWLLAALVVLVKMAVLVMLVMRAVLDVLVVTGSSCFANMTTTPMRVPNATNTNTNDTTPIIMNFPHFTVQPASALLSSSS